MEAYFSAVVASAIIVVGVAGFLGAILVLRNPHNPAWVQNEVFAQVASLLMTFGFVSALAISLSGFISIGLSVIETLSVIAAMAIVTGFVFCQVTHFRERLKRADQGRSTLERLGHDYPHTGASAA